MEADREQHLALLKSQLTEAIAYCARHGHEAVGWQACHLSRLVLGRQP